MVRPQNHFELDEVREEVVRTKFLHTDASKMLLFFNAIIALAYFIVIAFVFPRANHTLFGFLIAGEVFHVWQILTYLYTVWDTEYQYPKDPTYTPTVDIFIPVVSEPKDIVRETIAAALAMDYPNHVIHILNDGFVAKNENWRDMEDLAREMGVNCITRTIPGGAKAGNINHALSVTKSNLVAIFDCDHVPHVDFLRKTVPYMYDARVAFVQTPQFYKNYNTNHITRSTWEQQELFFGPICKGKNRLNSATMCGTNMVVRRSALDAVGGMCTESIAEDFVTGMFMHAKGYKSVYVPEVLAEGLGTEDLLTYYKQQFRWARGALDVMFRYNVIFRRGLTMAQRIQYLSSASFYLSGVFVVIDALLPVIFFYTGLIPLQVSGMLLATLFLPYMFLTLYTLQRTSNFTFTFRSMGFSMGAFTIHLAALVSAITRQKVAFVVTPKQQQQGNFVRLVYAHFGYIALVAIGIVFALVRFGPSASIINNLAWAVINIGIFVPFIQAALPETPKATQLPSVLPEQPMTSAKPPLARRVTHVQ